MANFPKQILKNMALGSAGDVLKGLHSYYLQDSYPVKDDNSVKVGGFVQLDTDGIHIKGVAGGSVSGKIVGVAVKDEYFVSCGADAVATYPKNTNASVLKKGVILIQQTTSSVTAKEGQYVFVKTDDGSLGFDDTTTKSSYTYTGFKVYKGGGQNEIIAIVSE